MRTTMAAVLVIINLIIWGAVAYADSPEYVTTRDGSVCAVQWPGNAGPFSGTNYLGMDYNTCKHPGLEAIVALTAAAEGECPAIPDCGEEDELVLGPGGGSSYPCIKRGPD